MAVRQAWCEDSSFPAEACQGVPCVGQSLQRFITKEAEESEISGWQVRDPGDPWHHPRPSWSLKEGEDQCPSWKIGRERGLGLKYHT